MQIKVRKVTDIINKSICPLSKPFRNDEEKNNGKSKKKIFIENFFLKKIVSIENINMEFNNNPK